MADKKIKVQVDVETDVEPSLAQLRLLKKQLKETAAGSAEFINLQRQIDDVQDSLVAARAGAGNFADVLGTLPGPIGAIGGQLSGTVATLKQFSALKISNIQASFVELGNDIVDVVKGIGQLTGITKVYTVINGFLAKSFVAIGVAEGTAAAGATAFAAALTATGVGAIVVAIGLAVAALIEMAKELYATATGERELQRAIDKTNAAIETQQRLFDLNAKSAENRRKVTIAQMKAQGKTEAEIRKYQIDQSYADYQAAFTAEQEAVKIYNEGLGKLDAEGLKKAQENLDKRQQASKDAYATYLETGYNAKAEELKEEENKNKELAGKRKAASDSKKADIQRDLQELKKGLEEARLATLTDEQREFEQVRIKYDELKAQAIKYGSDTKVIEEAREKENKTIRDKYAKENLDKKQKELTDTIALEEQQLNLRVAKAEISEDEFQTKLFELRKNAAIKAELLTNETLQKEQDKLNNQRIASLANLQIALQNEQSNLQDSLDKQLITQEQFDAQQLTLKNKFNTDSQLVQQTYQTNLDTASAESLQKNKDYIAAQIDLEKYNVEQKKTLAEEERGIILTNLQSRLEALDAENQRIEFDFEEDLARLAEQRTILAEQEATELANTELTEFQKTEIRQKYADARKQISDQEIATEKAATQAKHEINMAYLGLFEQFGNVLGQVAGKNKALAIAGVVISQAAAIGQIIAQTGMANAKAVAASPLTFGMPWVAINTVSAALSIASTIAGAVKSIQQINQAAAQGGVKGGEGAGASAAASAPPPAPPRVSGAAAPQIQTSGGMNPTTQIAETINKSQAPLRAYVVSGEVSSAQALDRRTSRAATFTGG